MSYEHNGDQYVVIAAGGPRGDDQGQGDYLIAFKVGDSARGHNTSQGVTPTERPGSNR